MVNGIANTTHVRMVTPSGFIVYWDDRRCILCENCIKACPNQAIFSDGEEILLDRSKCLGCGTCVETCVMGARDLMNKDFQKPSFMHLH